MRMIGSNEISAPNAVVWEALFDPEILRRCIYGCQELDRVSDCEYRASVLMAVGPIKAKFTGKIIIADAVQFESCRLVGEGSGGVAGFAKGAATVTVQELATGTLIQYEVDSKIGGKLAQLGSRVVNSTAKKMADHFFENFATIVSASDNR